MYIYVYTDRVTCSGKIKIPMYVYLYLIMCEWEKRKRWKNSVDLCYIGGDRERGVGREREFWCYISLHHWVCYEDHELLSESEAIKWRWWFIISKYFVHSHILSISMLHSGNGKSGLHSNIPLIHALHMRVWTQKSFHGISSAPPSFRVNYVLITIFPDTISHMAKATQQASGEA